MATVMEVIEGIMQAAANGYDGARNDDGSMKKTGLKRDEEVSIRDSRVIDGFAVKLHSGNKLCVTYTTEVLSSEVLKSKGKYEDSLLQNVADIVSFLKSEYRKVTGSSLTLKEIKDMEPEFDIIQTSRVRTEVKVKCHYEVGQLSDTTAEKDSYREKLMKGVDKWLSISSDKRPQNDTRKKQQD